MCKALGYKCIIFMPNTQSQVTFCIVIINFFWHPLIGEYLEIIIISRKTKNLIDYKKGTFFYVSSVKIFILSHNLEQEKIECLATLGAEVRAVPAVPYADENNYNHQVIIKISIFIS